MSRIVIVGAGGLGKEVLEILMAQGVRADAGTYVSGSYVAGFIDDNPILEGKKVNGIFVHKGESLIMSEADHIIAVGDNEARKELAERLDGNIHRDFTNAIHPSAIIPMDVQVGVDIIIGAGAILTEPSIKVGNHVHIDAGVVVSHDVVLEDYVRLNPGALIMGGCVIREGAYIGAGAVIRNGAYIGAWSTVGMGSVVTKDVPAGATVMGNPARQQVD